MKKAYLSGFIASMVIFAMFIPFNRTYAQSKSISIKINNVEYENPGFASLKSELKKMPAVSSLKMDYDNKVATLTFLYRGTAEQLWDNIPAANKKYFKINAMEGNNIVLNPVSSSAAAPEAKPDSKNNNEDKGDCRSCTYFPLCNYDYTRSFQGKKYKGINYDGNIIYYRYENGNLISKTEQFNEYGASLGFTTEIILKCNAPKGTTWEVKAAGGLMTATKEYEIVAKGIPLTIDGKNYDNVLVVGITIKGKSPVLFNNSNQEVVMSTSKIFYAKGIGFIKETDNNILQNEMLNGK